MDELQKFESANNERLQQLLAGFNPGHDNTQMSYFIVGQGITDYGKYKQALAELNSHYEALKLSYIQEKRTLVEIKILEKKISEETDLLQKELLEIDLEEKKLKIDSIKKQATRNTKELNKMFELASEYEKKIAGKDLIELEKDFHINRFKKLLAVNTVWRGGNLSGVMDTLTTLPEDMLKPLLEEFSALSITEQRNLQVSSSQAQQLLLNEAKENEQI